MNVQMEKKLNRGVLLPSRSFLFCFVTIALSSADITVFVAEVVRRHCGLRETWNPSDVVSREALQG